MFERYTEKARRVIFFARYEASQFGSPYIESEHLLLGLLREDKALTNRFLRSHASVESIRKQIKENTTIRERIATSVDLPLSNECKRILAYGAEEAERLGHKHIGTEHLLLGTLREEKCLAAAILKERGVELEKVREELASVAHEVPLGTKLEQARGRGSLASLIDRLIGLDDEQIELLLTALRAMDAKTREKKTRERSTEEMLVEIGTESLEGARPESRVDLTRVQSTTPLGTKLLRALWHCFQLPFWPHTPRMLSPLRIFLLRMFGAKIGPGCQVDGGVKIWVPWNLKMGTHSTIGFNSEIYNFASVEIGDHVVVSQRSYLCTSTHEYTHPHFLLVSSPIRIESQSWVAAQVFVAPGVTVREGAVIGACSVVTRSMPAWMVCAGNPCRPIKKRVIKSTE